VNVAREGIEEEGVFGRGRRECGNDACNVEGVGVEMEEAFCELEDRDLVAESRDGN